eukprot:CAMPEP_0168530382 /NCGR_PEP_ID=MMETSP0405-20121227/14626_1 /TAXON_ID=498012 /ORGANISM="Trichosphaerium sp, Strain Am-I-7 wt" /LENGTH=77 /DNA_ID=CAMNT_0008554597 /DNA_START=8 /DNA_END=237 /DNA_ORIENTATION=+
MEERVKAAERTIVEQNEQIRQLEDMVAKLSHYELPAVQVAPANNENEEKLKEQIQKQKRRIKHLIRSLEAEEAKNQG